MLRNSIKAHHFRERVTKINDEFSHAPAIYKNPEFEASCPNVEQLALNTGSAMRKFLDNVYAKLANGDSEAFGLFGFVICFHVHMKTVLGTAHFTPQLAIAPNYQFKLEFLFKFNCLFNPRK